MLRRLLFGLLRRSPGDADGAVVGRRRSARACLRSKDFERRPPPLVPEEELLLGLMALDEDLCRGDDDDDDCDGESC